MSNLARILAVVALILWPASALANMPPPEPEAPPAQQGDPNAPATIDAPPVPTEPAPVADPTDTAPPAAMEEGGSSMGTIVGVIAFLAVAAGAGYWFMNRNRA